MAKRKKLKNIQISNQELTPTTIGYLDSKQKGPLLLVLIFAILFATLYYMPDLTELLSGKKVPMENNPTTTVYDDEGNVFMFNSTTLITVNNIEFSKINIDNNQISIHANNTKDAVVYLTGYYIELYDKDDKILERIDLSNESLNKYGKRTFTYGLANPKETNKISISVISNNELPEIELRTEDGVQELTCVNANVTYDYEFNENKLKKVIQKIKAEKTDYEDEVLYVNDYQKYQSLAEVFPYAGLTQLFSNTENGYSFTKTIDLTIADGRNVDDEMFYKLDETASKVAFQNSLKKYKCY